MRINKTPMFRELIEYVQNIELGSVEDTKLLERPFKEIKGYENRLISNGETREKIEKLLEICSIEQLTVFYQQLEMEKLGFTSSGSKAIEKIHRHFFRHIYACNAEDKQARKSLEVVYSKVDPLFERLFFDSTGTFVLRPYFELLSGRHTNYHRIKQKEANYRIEKTEIKKSKIYEDFYVKLKSYAKLLKEKISSIFAESFTSETFVTYLKCNKDREIIEKVVKTYFAANNLREPIFSYFFESLIGFASKKILKEMFEAIENEIPELSLSENSNYVVKRLCERHEPKLFYEKIKLSIEKYPRNSNFVLSLLLSLYEHHEKETFFAFLKDFYGPESIFENILMKQGRISHKYVCLANFVMSLKDKQGIVRQFNLDFLRLFDSSWLYERAGQELVLAFIKGSALPSQKESFVADIKNEYQKMSHNYYSKKLLPTLSHYANDLRKLQIINILKKS